MKNKALGLIALVAVLWASCKSGTSNYEGASTADTTKQAVAGNITQADTGHLLVKTADMGLKVKSVDSALVAITRLCAKTNTTISHLDRQGKALHTEEVELNADSIMRISTMDIYATLTLQIPAEKLDEVINDLALLSTVVQYQKKDVDDRTLDYLQSQMKLKTRTTYLAHHHENSTAIDSLQNFNSQDEIINKTIANKRLLQNVKYSTLTLSIEQNQSIVREVVANTNTTTRLAPYGTRLMFALSNGLHWFSEVVLFIANFWMFGLAAIAAWLLYKRFITKREN